MARPRVPDLRQRRVLITGAASGIGRATAAACGAEGAELYLVDRDAGKLDEAAAELRSDDAKVAFHAPVDLADHDQVVDMAAAVHAAAPSMDVVMNVAGISTWGSVDRLEHRQWRQQVDVNLMGPVHVIEQFVPPMISAGGGGYLVNVASAAGLLGLPWHAAYSASKFGLRGVSEVLRFDLRRHRIGVSLVCPGAVRTPLMDTVQVAGVDTTSDRFQRAQAMFGRHAVSPERVAGKILDAVHDGTYLVHTSADIRLLYGLQRYCPPLHDAVMLGMNRVFTRVLG